MCDQKQSSVYQEGFHAGVAGKQAGLGQASGPL